MPIDNSKIHRPRGHRPVTQKRVDHICDLMREMKFVTGKTIKTLAKEWGLSISSVKELSAEASKIVRAEITDHDKVIALVGPALEKAILHCVETKDYRHLANLAKVFMDGTGASAPKSHSLTVKNEFEGLTQEQLLAEAKREMAKLEEDGIEVRQLPSAESRTVPMFDEPVDPVTVDVEFKESEEE